MRLLAPAVALAAGLLAIPAPAAPAPKDQPRVLAVCSTHTGNAEIFLVYPDTGDIKNLTRNKASDTEPVWSPDGKRIAFVSDRSGSAEVWVMGADGGDPKQITEKSGGCTWLRWSPDGKKIAFVSGKSGTDHIYAADAETGKVKQLTDGEAACRQPAWSPDGKTLAYSYYAGVYGIYVMDADGGNKESLAGQGGGLDADWSADGKRVTFTSVRSGGFRVFTIDPDGRNVKELTTNDNNFGNVFPRFSPDGKTIAYGELVGGVIQVAVVGSDGTGAKVITSKGTNAFPRWSPDGKTLAFARHEADQPPALIVSDPDGQNQREVLRGYSSGEWQPK